MNKNRKTSHVRQTGKTPSIRKRIFDIIQVGNRNDFPSLFFDICLVCVIVINILVLVLETFDFNAGTMHVFWTVEIVTVVLFCVEYLLRMRMSNGIGHKLRMLDFIEFTRIRCLW